MNRKTVRYRAFYWDDLKKIHFKGHWRNTAKEAAGDLKLCPGSVVQRVELGSPVRITIVNDL